MTQTTSLRLRSRSGFSLSELLIALTLTAVVGAAVTSLFVSQNRFFDSQQKLGSAREVSRSALNVVLAEMRMIEQDSGVVAAAADSVVLRVPFAMGIICTADASSITALLLPNASEIYGDRLPSFRGYMFRSLSGNGGRYTYVGSLPAQVSNGSKSTCTGAGVQADSIPNHRIVTVTPGHAAAATRFPFMMYGEVTYRFANSTSVPGRLALYRQPAGGSSEELVAPFANTARFRFYSGAALGAAQDNPPADLSNLNGIELVLDGLSERPEPDGTYPTVPLRTSVFFQNRRD